MAFRSRSRFTTYLFSPVTSAVVFVVAGLLALQVWERYEVAREMAARSNEAAAELSELQERRATLQERVEYLEGEHGREAEIRTLFDVAKEGEQVVVIVDEESTPTTTSSSAPAEAVEEDNPWYVFWQW